MKDDQSYQGASDILESLIGKYKKDSDKGWIGNFGYSLLKMAAHCGEICGETVLQA